MTVERATLAPPASADDWAIAKRLVEEYASSLGFDLGFQGFAHEIESLPAEYGPPGGAFVLASIGGDVVGCGGLRRFDDTSCEMKRLYVAPRHRGAGVGRAIVMALIDNARAIGYRVMLLDTLQSMTAAQALYASCGFTQAAAYRHNPLPGAMFWRKIISGTALPF